MSKFITKRFVLADGTHIEIFPTQTGWAGRYFIEYEKQGFVNSGKRRDIPDLLRYEIAMAKNPKIGKVSKRIALRAKKPSWIHTPEPPKNLQGLEPKYFDVNEIFDHVDVPLIKAVEQTGFYESKFTNMAKDIIVQAHKKKLSSKQRSVLNRYAVSSPNYRVEEDECDEDDEII